jgi:branched-chain amino acid transport system substrate-binding protein
MTSFNRRNFITTVGSAAALAPLGALAQKPAGQPVRVGGSLALTGGLASLGLIHKLVGEMYVEQLNQRGGLLGRPVEWVLKDDQSRIDLTRTLYEQLLTGDKVDLLIGPFGTGAILSAMGVAQRYNKTIVHHTFGIPELAKYDQQFASWALGANPEVTMPRNVLDALASVGKAPKTIAVVTSKFPSVQFIAFGARKEAEKRGIKEVLFLEWEFGNREFGSIAGRIKAADPDLIWVGGNALDGNQLLDALKKIDYQPHNHFHQYPSPGPLATAPEGNNALTVTIFENNAPFTNSPAAAAFAKGFTERAKAAGLPYVEPDTQAAASYAAWQLIEAAVTATKSIDDKTLAAWLRANTVDTVAGKLRFNGPNNTGDDLNRIKQVQGAAWKTVWPADYAAAGARLRAN